MAKVSSYSAQGGAGPKPVVTPLPGSHMSGGIKGGQPSGGRSAPGAKKYTSKSPMGTKAPGGGLSNKPGTGALPIKNSKKVYAEPHHQTSQKMAGESGSRIDSTSTNHPGGAVEQHHRGYVAKPVRLARHTGFGK